MESYFFKEEKINPMTRAMITAMAIFMTKATPAKMVLNRYIIIIAIITAKIKAEIRPTVVIPSLCDLFG